MGLQIHRAEYRATVKPEEANKTLPMESPSWELDLPTSKCAGSTTGRKDTKMNNAYLWVVQVCARLAVFVLFHIFQIF